MTDETTRDAEAIPPVESPPAVAPPAVAEAATAAALAPATIPVSSDPVGHAPVPHPYSVPHGTHPGSYATAYAYGAPPPRGMSTTSMVLGIVSLVATIVLLGWVTAIPGVILGHLGLKREPAGRGMAIAGLIMSYAVLGLSIVLVVVGALILGWFFAMLASIARF